MPADPLVTVVVGAFNAGEYLLPAVSSVLAQSYQEFEVLIIDDGSTDNSMESLKELRDPRLRILHQENQGRAATLNRAIGEARGEFYVIQDADDLSHPDRIQRLVNGMRSHPEVAGIFSGHEIILDGKPMAPRFAAKGVAECRHLIDSFRMPAHDPTGMFRMSMAGEFRYDVSLPYTEAVDYVLRIGERLPLMVLGECLYSYRVHLGSITKRDPAVRDKYVAECFRRACERRGVSAAKAFGGGRRSTLGKNALADNNLAAEFIESVLDQRRAGQRLAAVMTGLRCARLHPADLHYQKALIYSIVPESLITRLRCPCGGAAGK